MKEKKKKITLEHWQIIALYLAIYDLLAVNLPYLFTLWIRFDCRFTEIPHEFVMNWAEFCPVYSAFCLIVFWKCRLYNSLWRFASYDELFKVFKSSVITLLFHVIVSVKVLGKMPLSYYLFGGLLQFLAVLAIRFAYRFLLLVKRSLLRAHAEKNKMPVMLIGAGIAGQTILKEINRAKELQEDVCCFVDDNSNKWHRYIDGVLVEGGRERIPELVEKYDIQKIYVAIPSATFAERKEILNICQKTNCTLKSLPGIYQLANGEVSISTMKEVEITDLLGRDAMDMNMDKVFQFIEEKTILVTGGGGSIGSELCRQIARHNPKQLIIFDIYENNAYDIQLELKKKYPDLDLKTFIGSVRDSRKIFKIFDEYRPDVVYHAAAHKHVPLMEDSPCEAIKNNAIGTYKTAYAAMVHNCQRFVLISTDKAVNPTNIMGASKRLCEMIVQSFDYKIKQGRAEEIPQLFSHREDTNVITEKRLQALRTTKTEFVAVRFGNVLGSNGSVIPLFKKQIAAGGPVTVTHPDIIRYFMTIPEAVSLVLLAGTFAKGGEIFVLDMGEQVKIDELARNLIRLSGYKPDEDIKIIYTGLRPGEKLYEEKLMAEEGIQKTENELIYIGHPIPFDIEIFLQELILLDTAAYQNKEDKIRKLVQNIVETYHPNE